MRPSKLMQAIALVMTNPEQYYPERKDWQDVEQGQVSRDFADFVEAWIPGQTAFTSECEITENSETYKMKADDVPFTFKRTDDSYTLIYNGCAEEIQESTFNQFVDSLCAKFSLSHSSV